MVLVQDRMVVWNASRLKEIDEAKATIVPFLKKGYKVLNKGGEAITKFHPSLEEVLIKATSTEGKSVLKILCDLGDDRLCWSKENGREAKEAKLKFMEFLGKGFKAYSVDSLGKKKQKIEEFDVDAEEILMVPPTVKG